MTAPAAQKPLAGLRLFSGLLLLVSVALVIGAYLLAGIDFSLGVLLGSGIVVVNFFWSIRVFSRVLGEDHSRARLGTSWVLKFGFTALVLYFAVVRFGMHTVGIMVGVSSVVLAGLVFAAANKLLRRVAKKAGKQ